MSTKRKQEWFDNDEFWQDLYPFMFPEKRFETTPASWTKPWLWPSRPAWRRWITAAGRADGRWRWRKPALR